MAGMDVSVDSHLLCNLTHLIINVFRRVNASFSMVAISLDTIYITLTFLVIISMTIVSLPWLKYCALYATL